VIAVINWIINAKSTDIRQQNFAFYGPIVYHWTGSNSSWKLILDSNQHHSWCFCDSGANVTNETRD